MNIIITKTPAPVLKPELYKGNPFRWDSLWVYHPRLVVSGKTYYLFYTGKSIKKGVSHKLGVATSKDFKTWEKVNHPLLSSVANDVWDSDFTAHSFIYKDGQQYYMLYDGSKKGMWKESIGLAVSKDLLTWRRYEGNPIFSPGKNTWESNHVSRCCVYKEKGTSFLFYAGHDGSKERIGMAKGKDIFHLKRVTSKPILDVGKKGEWDEDNIADPQIIKHKGVYLMFYSGIDSNKTERVGLAISKDLKQWKKYDKNPILDVGKTPWDKTAASRFDISLIKDTFYLFYSGKSNRLWQIGYAKLKIV